MAKKYELETYNPGGPGNPNGLNTWLIIFSKNENTFVLNLVEKSKEDFSKYSQILSTFRFIDR
jgi:hypothetical protein